MSKPGMIDSDKFDAVLKKLFLEDRFEALKMPLFVAATDIVEGKTKFFHKGDLIRPILAPMVVLVAFIR